MLNLIILVTEDDRSGQSHFFLDLANLNNIPNYPNINCHIRYYSLKNHGNYHFHFHKDGHKMEPIPPLKNMDDVEYLKLACDFLDECYIENETNAFIFSSHCWNFSWRPHRRNINSFPVVQHMEKQQMKFKFILFDCCNTSCIETLYMYRNVTDYLIGCQSACPAIGFLTQDLAHVLSKKESWISILKKVTNAFLKRNNEHKVKKDLYETDCTILTTKYADQIPNLFNGVTFFRDQKARTQPTPQERTIFDLVTLLKTQDQIDKDKKQDIMKWVKKTILSYKQSNLMKTKSWAHKLHGISIILNREKVVKKL